MQKVCCHTTLAGGVRNDSDNNDNWVVIGKQGGRSRNEGGMSKITCHKGIQDISAVVPVAPEVGVTIRFIDCQVYSN